MFYEAKVGRPADFDGLTAVADAYVSAQMLRAALPPKVEEASIDLSGVINSAARGRVDTLFSAQDTRVCGNLDPAADGFINPRRRFRIAFISGRALSAIEV